MPTDCSDANLGIQIDIYGNPPNIHTNTLNVKAEAFNVLYSCLSGDVYTYLYFMGCRQTLADTIVIHTWDQVIKYRRYLADLGSKDPSSIRTYVFNQTRTKLLQHIRELQDSVWDPNDKRPEVKCIMQLPKLDRGMQLPKLDRDIFLLRRMHLSNEAIANICDLNLEEVAVSLKRSTTQWLECLGMG